MSFKAIRVNEFGDASVLKLEEVPEPELAPEQILVRVHAVGVNPVDTYIRTGTYARKPSLPYTPGSDAAGVVEKVGSADTRWKVGDRVYLAGSESGTYAEKVVCLANHLHRLPERVSFAQGSALFVPYGTAYHAIHHRAAVRSGETVLVHGGSGGVGIAAIQLLTAIGARVFATASSEAGRAAIEKYGATAFNHREDGYEKKILEATGGKGVDVILEMLANVNLDKDISTLIGVRGRIVVIGNRGRSDIDARGLMSKGALVTGVALAAATQKEFHEIFSAIEAGLERGFLDPVVSEPVFKLAQASEAHVHVIERPSGTVGKVILEVD